MESKRQVSYESNSESDNEDTSSSSSSEDDTRDTSTSEDDVKVSYLLAK